MSVLSEKQLKYIEQQLRINREALQTHLYGVERAMDGERYVDIAGTVHSQSDESFAELATALSNASLGREAEALHEIEEALHRLATHSYGYCTDCGKPIALERLRSYPTAKRCRPCQLNKENRYGGKDSTPSL
ncbi:MAG: TraR/DksA C4-type zinc finger protein [Gammaproteobacteria bacterium]|nr:TraR/DksA C4-type zinc finger protein [Gammaproteobacteria bacterium]